MAQRNFHELCNDTPESLCKVGADDSFTARLVAASDEALYRDEKSCIGKICTRVTGSYINQVFIAKLA